jgi:hypothetical protein
MNEFTTVFEIGADANGLRWDALFRMAIGILAVISGGWSLRRAWRGERRVTEGVIHVTHQQPAHGHSSGDKISVGGRAFEVNYYLATPGYKQTIAHGGALREGVYARLHYEGGVILKVEVKQPSQ